MPILVICDLEQDELAAPERIKEAQRDSGYHRTEETEYMLIRHNSRYVW